MSVSFRKMIRRLVPRFLVVEWRRHLTRQSRKQFIGKTTQEIFESIYATNAWGGEQGRFDSGTGSTDGVTQSYCDCITSFIRDHNVQTVLDLGCGDFRVGARLADAGIDYIGVDVVPELIAHHNRTHASERVAFLCANICKDHLPDADLVLIRQVLQHLSNDAIHAVLKNVERYRSVIVSEHYPAGSVRMLPNLDKPTGADVRVMFDSAVVLDAPPFNVSGVELLLETPVPDPLLHSGESIRTYLVSR